MTKKTNEIKHQDNSEASELPDDKLPSSDEKLGSFADRLRETIGGQSIRSFAAACNLSDGVIRQYLAGKSEPGLEALLKIAYVGNVNIEWLASGNGEKSREPFTTFLKGATERRKRTSLFNARASIVLECFNTVNIQSILNRNERVELINFVNDYNANIILPAKEGSDRLIKSITVSDLTDWCREAWLYSETFSSWYKSSYYQYKRGQIRKDHPLAWTINNAGTSEAEMRRGDKPAVNDIVPGWEPSNGHPASISERARVTVIGGEPVPQPEYERLDRKLLFITIARLQQVFNDFDIDDPQDQAGVITDVYSHIIEKHLDRTDKTVDELAGTVSSMFNDISLLKQLMLVKAIFIKMVPKKLLERFKA